MATLRDGRVPKNNLQEHLARYKSTNRESSSSIATSQPERKKSFTFYKVTAPSSGSLTTGFTPPFKPNGGHTKPTQSIPNTVPSFQGRQQLPPNQRRTSLTFNTSQASCESTPHNQKPSIRVTSFFNSDANSSSSLSHTAGNYQEQRKNPLVAKVAPVSSQPCTLKGTSSIGAETTAHKNYSDSMTSRPSYSPVCMKPPGSSLLGSTPHIGLTPSQPHTLTPSQPHTHLTSPIAHQAGLAEVHRELYSLMNDVCDLLSDVPPATVSSLLGTAAAHIQRKLAKRKLLQAQEQELQQQQSSSPLTASTISQSSIAQSCSSVTSPFPRQLPASLSPYKPPTHQASYGMESSLESDAAFTVDVGSRMTTRESFDDDFDCLIGDDFDEWDDMESDEVATAGRPPSVTQSIATTRPTPQRPPPRSFLGGGSSVACGTSGPSKQLERRKEATPTDNAHEFRGQYPHTQNMFKIFKQIFGLKQFRLNQLEAVNAVILNKDCFILMPTGGGKSLCYQLPALVSPGVTVVVSPLRSLIQDQVQKLCSLEVPARCLSSDITKSEENEVYSSLSLRTPTIKLLYLTPEKLGASMKLQSTLRALHNRNMLSRFVIDEAHCISSWGHDFRPDYKRLCELRQKYPGVPIVALTATATPRVRADVLHQLNITSSCKWFTQSFNRINLQYSIVPKKPKRAVQDIVDLVKTSFKDQSGIIYCLSRKDCDKMADELCNANVAALSYHAGLGDSERSMAQQRWVQEDQCKVVCATIAFGMGIDKPDVRFVIHHSLPKSVEGYYQEAGRAGRDGLPARCILFYNYSDMTRLRRMIQLEKLRREQERVHLDNLYRMVQYCENETDCRRAQLLQYFAETFDSSLCQNSTTPCDNCQSQTPYRKEDVTELVRVIVQSVQQVTRDQYTLIQYACALKGSVSNKVMSSVLSSLPLYRRGEKWSKHDLERLLHMLVLNDILCENLTIGAHDNVVSYVKLGSKAYDVLSGKITGIIMNIKGKASKGGNKGGVDKGQTKEEQLKTECYSVLQRQRTITASRLMLKNPETLVSSLALQEMSQNLPTDKDGMMAVNGVTESNWKRMNGELFLEITCEYAAKIASVQSEASKGKSPYFESENTPPNAPSVGRGKRKRDAPPKNSSKKAKMKQSVLMPAATVADIVTDEDAFEQPPSSFLSARKPGLMPPPKPKPKRT